MMKQQQQPQCLMMTTRRLHHWIQQEGPTAAKHRGWAHPIAVLILHYLVATTVTLLAHDAMLAWYHRHISTNDSSSSLSCRSPDESSFSFQTATSTTTRHLVARFFVCYFLWLVAWRLLYNNNKNTTTHPRTCVLYETTWLCNVTLLLGAVGLLWNRPLLATAHCIAVSIDQVMWYVDLVGWAASGFCKFPIGVAQYLTWPGTSWLTRITCTHHLWTIPLLLYTSEGLHWLSFPLSVVIVVTHVLLSRYMTPFCVQQHDHNDDIDDMDDGDSTSKQPASSNNHNNTKYLNVNLSHELWKDIRMKFLQISHDQPPVGVYLWRLLWRWQVLNFLVFVGLFVVSLYWLGEAPPLC